MKTFTYFLLILFLSFFSNFSVFGQISVKEEIKIVQREFYKAKNDSIKVDLSFLDSIKIPPVKIEREKKKEDFVCILIAEPVATFEGGMENFYKVIGENLEFPKEAKTGRVFFQFVIDTIGKMTAIEFIESPSQENNKAVLKLIDFINENYTWKPAQQRGKKIKVRMNIPIIFRREEKQKSNTERIYRR
ncbi:Gram-negative bacterial tonB protein [Bernardetia litoralis DSM 6794]|uniref:Gram-negative bacterial tonB protein n=1 Tax=Bernardetia litoralis (strain ATCC 23117 / DSM 6794 / NBRC 15988 / NCIMB 1366 / Fx l1 / Sio-4) TaxID=880071 RepID=I4AJV2_BERLS|nr:energy transducer TonB [Bernardetia litoralis]AFM04237.1 Gram-negative bacterial tonB protein [Bernardetia litoralis DSM 6794]